MTDKVKVLPLSPMDDRLRLAVARAIYRDPAFAGYAVQAVPPIHIIVENGHVTLAGMVNNNLEKQLAGVRASGALSSAWSPTTSKSNTPPPRRAKPRTACLKPPTPDHSPFDGEAPARRSLILR